MYPNKLFILMYILFLTSCSLETNQDMHQPTNIQAITKVAKYQGMIDPNGHVAGFAANLNGKLVIMDNCLLLEYGNPKQPNYVQPVFSERSYHWDETRKVLISKNENGKEYPIGSYILLGGGGWHSDDKLRQEWHLPKCSMSASIWLTD